MQLQQILNHLGKAVKKIEIWVKVPNGINEINPGVHARSFGGFFHIAGLKPKERIPRSTRRRINEFQGGGLVAQNIIIR